MQRKQALLAATGSSGWAALLPHPTVEGGGAKNMRSCETNPFVMYVNAEVIHRWAMRCASHGEDYKWVRLAKPNPFWARFAQGDRRAATVGRLTLSLVAI